MRRLLLPLLVAASPALAQEDEDRGFLVGLIEDNLSAPGLAVRLEGFEGALSSEASLDALTVSDDEGVWLRLEDVVLDWNRSALLRGRLEVEELTAGLIRYERAPLPPEGFEPPEAGAGGFSIPDLPVAVRIEQLAAQRIELGEAVLGQPAALTLEASAVLADGALDLSATADRLDGPEGRFVVAASFDPGGTLSVDVDLSEAEGGLAATLLGIPGTPALDLGIEGSGPLDDFTAEVRLATEGVERVGGTVALRNPDGTPRFAVDLEGDPTPLLAPRYRDFFGDAVSIEAAGARGATFALDRLSVEAAALSVEGRAEIGADGWPRVLDLSAVLADPDGGPVLLPVAGSQTVGRADVTLDYDASVSDEVTLDGVVRDYSGAAATLDRLALVGRGTIARGSDGAPGAARGRLGIEAAGLALSDPALAEAVGDAVALSTDVAWAPDAPLRLSDLSLEAGEVALSGSVAARDFAEGLPLDLDLDLSLPTLRRFAALAGIDLRGAADLSLSGTAAPLAGSFDLALDGTGTDLATGIAQADALLEGTTDLALRARRDETGTVVEDLSLRNPQATITGAATILAEDAQGWSPTNTGTANLDIRLADVSPVVAQLEGPGTLDLDLRGGADAWRGVAGLALPEGIEATVSGTLTGPDTDLDVTASVPDLSVLAPVEGSAAVEGRVFRRGEAFAVDLSGNGPWTSTLTLKGVATGPDAELAFAATLPRLDAVAAVPEPLAGPARVRGTLASDEGAYVLDATLEADGGVTAEVVGPVAGRPLDLMVDAAVADLSALAPLPGLAGEAALTGRVFADGDATRVDLSVDGPEGLAGTVEGAVAGAPLAIRFDVGLDDLSALSGAVPAPLAGPGRVSGSLEQRDGAFVLDAGAQAPEGVTARVEGVVAGGPLDVDAAVRVPEVAALGLLPAGIDGPMTLDARLRSAGAGLAVDAALDGPDGISGTVSGPVTGAALDVAIDLRVADVAALEVIPGEIAGAATLEGRVFREDGAIAVDVALDGPEGIAATVQGPVTGEALDVAVAARVPDVGRLVAVPERLSGPATLDARAVSRDGAIVVSLDLDAPEGISVTAEGPVTGDDVRATFAAVVPDTAVLADLPPALRGRATLEGTLSGSSEAYVLDAALEGPGGLSAVVDGQVTGPDADATFSATVPAIEAFAAVPEGLRGAASVEGRLTMEDGAYVVDAALAAPAGIAATVQGAVTGGLSLAVTAEVPRIEALAPVPPALEGAATLAGTVEQEDGAIVVDLRAEAPAGIVLRAEGPATGEAARIAFTATVPEIGALAEVPGVEGTLSVDGAVFRQGADWAVEARAAGPLDARVRVDAVLTQTPLRIAFDASVPSLAPLAPVPGGLDVAGTATLAEGGVEVDMAGDGPYGAVFDLSGTATGDAPELRLNARIDDAARLAPQLRGPLALSATARQREGQWSVDAEASGAQGLRASVSGVVTGPALAIDYRVQAANLGAFAPGLDGALDASGSLRRQNGSLVVDVDARGPFGSTLRASGPLDGTVTFDAAVPDVGVFVPDFRGPLRARGTATPAAGGAYALDVDVDGPGGTQAAVSGTVGGAAGLGLSVRGTAPLGLANPFLEPRRLAGTAAFDLRVAPGGLNGITGTVTTSGATLVLPTLRNGLEGIDARVTLTGTQAQVDLSARVATGGRLSLRGPVGLSAPFDAALRAEFDVVLEDPTLYSTRARGEVAVTGPLTGGALIAGRIALDETEISVPSTGLTALGPLPPIRHVNVDPAVRRTLERADLDARPDAAASGADGAGGPVYRLDLTVTAPRIFVRGRGLDAELGGALTIGGTTAAPLTQGGFELVRGRLDVLQQRFDLDEGTISFQGSFVPYIRLVARTESGGIDAAIVVDGPATELEVSFESASGLPEEEIVAQILFGRDLTSLSPLQALQLANSIATLAGRGSGGLLSNLREGAGLDDLDVTTDAEGNTALRAGKYISDNVYTDVQIGQDGSARVTLNLDVTENLTIRGSAGAAGNTSLGIFYERDY